MITVVCWEGLVQARKGCRDLLTIHDRHVNAKRHGIAKRTVDRLYIICDLVQFVVPVGVVHTSMEAVRVAQRPLNFRVIVIHILGDFHGPVTVSIHWYMARSWVCRRGR